MNNEQEDEEEKSLSANVPFEELKNLWNEICRKLFGEVKSLSDERKKHLKARWNEHPSIDFWKDVFARLTTARWCLGENKRGWKADFDFIIKNNDKYVKLLEGRYDNPEAQLAQVDINKQRGVGKPEDYIGGVSTKDPMVEMIKKYAAEHNINYMQATHKLRELGKIGEITVTKEGPPSNRGGRCVKRYNVEGGSSAQRPY